MEPNKQGRKQGYGFVIGLLLALSTLVWAEAVTNPANLTTGKEVIINATDPLQGQWVAPPLVKTDFIPGELIVKYKSTVVTPVELLATTTTPSSSVSVLSHASQSLTTLHRKHHVHNVQPLFRKKATSVGGPQVLGLDTLAQQQAIKQKYPSRSARAQATQAIPDLNHVYVVKVAAAENIEATVEEFKKNPYVEYAQPNYIAKTQLVPSDSYYSTTGSWGQTYDDLWGLKKINAEQAWDASLGTGTVVAVVDSGLDYNHPDIATNTWINPGEIAGNGIDDDDNGYVDDYYGWDFVNSDADPIDDHGHGTHVAGIIGAVDNNIGVIGVAPRTLIMPVKGLNNFGSGSFSVLAMAIKYAADNGADVINNSWGCNYCPSNPVIEDAVRYAHGLGAVVVFAAGNSSFRDVADMSPQNMAETITVTASTHLDTAASFTSFGIVDVAAPGAGVDIAPPTFGPQSNILSLKSANCYVNLCADGLLVGTEYLRLAGTSMAAPHVAGLAALLIAKNPTWKNEMVRQAIRTGSVDQGATGFDPYFGYGRIDAQNSMDVLDPIATLITEPVNATLTGVSQVDIRGIADGPDFSQWRLEYGAGNTPTIWTQIASSSISTALSIGLLYTWPIDTVPDGEYTLRLIVDSESGAVYEDRRLFSIDQVVLDAPSSTKRSFYRAGDVVEVRGTVASVNFSSYTIKIYDGSGVELSNPTISLTNDGLQKIQDGVLGSWDTSGVSTEHYVLSLEVTMQDSTVVTESAPVVVDTDYHVGWPRALGDISNATSSFTPVADHLDVVDINGDNQADIITVYGSDILILDHTGELLPGWPQNVDPNGIGAFAFVSPAVGDLTGDGVPEIVVANYDPNFASSDSDVFVWQSDGTLLPGWPKNLGGNLNSISIGDIDGDGSQEIIATDWQGTIKVLDVNGNALPGWPQSVDAGLTGRVLSPASIGDLNGDGKLEIVVVNVSAPTNLYVFNHLGEILPGWPVAINPTLTFGNYRSYPVLGDLDGDGDLEIVIGTGTGEVTVLNHDATVLAGWPQQGKNTWVSTPAIGDIDGDGIVEVVAGYSWIWENNLLADYIYAWHSDGSVVTGWPVKYDRHLSLGWAGFSPAILADVDNDNVADVIASADMNILADRFGYTYPYSLNAYKGDGTKVAGFPKPGGGIAPSTTNTAAVADMDGDGLLELAWIDSSLNLYVWDLDSSASNSSPWPMFQHDAQHSGLQGVSQLGLTFTSGGDPDPIDDTGSSPPVAASSSGGGGGCTLKPRAAFDPLLPLLTVFALWYLWRRRRYH